MGMRLNTKHILKLTGLYMEMVESLAMADMSSPLGMSCSSNSAYSKGKEGGREEGGWE